jgi:hypothetical protein
MPLGATMVSQEGACSAYYQYGRLAKIRARHAETAEPSSDKVTP